MHTVSASAALRAQTHAWKAAGHTIALVPTMGNLHAGHLDLVAAARAAADRVLVSLFVNPTQFSPGEDFANYPRTLEADQAQLRQAGADLLFAPSVEEMYPHGRDNLTVIDIPSLTGLLCGQSRPGHFAGVAGVVAKLFNLCTPDLAWFGEKDFQQLTVIRRLVRDLNFPVDIRSAPTRRETDGLAMSSRNRYLTPEERRRAPELHATLCDLVERIRAGDRRYADLEREGETRLRAAGFAPDYVAIRRVADLLPPAPDADDHEARIVLAAARLGKARLIDNLRVERQRKSATNEHE